MCGISGYYTQGNDFSEDILRKMTAAISHRGPDADGFYFNESVGLGHKRLSIIDLSASANQPMISHNSRYAMVYNGEIYNFKEIEKEIVAHTNGFSLKTSSDSEVILEAFSIWGPDFVNKLNGMFAIAIYDKQENNLYIFRDRVGIKPIYYFWDKQNFAFASELKALMQSDFIKKNSEINYTAVNHFLHLGYIPEPHSIYKSIYKFPAGSWAIISNKGIEIKKFWSIEDKISETTLTDENEAKEKLKELLVSSVKYRMISDVPFGTFLSGGIDSSLVTAIAQSISDVPVNTFNIRFEDAAFDESKYAKQISDYLGTKHHQYTVTEKDALEFIPQMLGIYDEPFADTSAVPTLLVSKLAKQNVTMTLSGDGGDELFMGYGAYKWAERLNNPVLQLFRGPSKLGLSLLNNKYKRVSHLFEKVNNVELPAHIFSQEQYFFSKGEVKNLLNPQYLSDNEISKSENISRKLSPSEKQSLFDFKYYLKDDLLVKVDRASMQFSLETRVPLLDYRIVEFAYNLDPSLRLRNNTSKYLLKKVLYDYIPEKYFDRPKWGFGIPLGKWLQKDLRYLIEENLSENSVKSAGILNYDVVKKYKDEFLVKGRTYYYNRIWLIILLQNFMQNPKQ